MPYSSNADLPDYIKKLSSKMQTLWRKAFNSAFKSYSSGKTDAKSAEEYAFRVANAAVKKAKEKSKKESIILPDDMEYVSDEEFQQFESLLDGIEENTSHLKAIHFMTSLKEVQEESRTADIVALVKGWSYNGNFYSTPVAESLSTLLLQRNKIFANHTDDKKFGRKVQELAALVQEAKPQDGTCQAKIWFTPNPATSWLFEVAQKQPEAVQFSIDAMAQVHEGEMEGRKGIIVDKFVALNSLDIVDYASAGGVVLRTSESKEEHELSVLEEAANTLKDRVEKSVNRDKLSILMNCFIDMLYGLSYSYNEEDESSKKDKIKELVDSFLEEFNKIDIVSAFENTKGKGDSMNIEDLKKDVELVESVKKEMIEPEVNKVKSALETEKKALQDSLTAKETELHNKETELQGVKTELNGYKMKEALLLREQAVRKIVSDSTLKDFDKLPEYVQKDLLGKETDEIVKEAVKALEAILANVASGKIEGAGITNPPKKEDKAVDKTLAEDADKAANVFN